MAFAEKVSSNNEPIHFLYRFKANDVPRMLKVFLQTSAPYSLWQLNKFIQWNIQIFLNIDFLVSVLVNNKHFVIFSGFLVCFDYKFIIPRMFVEISWRIYNEHWITLSSANKINSRLPWSWFMSKRMKPIQALKYSH